MVELNKNERKWLILAISSIIFLFWQGVGLFMGFDVFFSLAGMLGVGFVILNIIRPEIGVYAMAGLLPLINLNIYLYSLEIPLIDGVAILSFLGFLLSRILFGNKIVWPSAFLFFCYTAAAIFSSVINQDFLSDIWYFVRWVVLCYTAYLIIPTNVIKSEDELKKVVKILAGSGLLVGLIGLASFLFQIYNMQFLRISPFSILGYFPLGENHNLLAETYLVTFFYILSLKLWSKNPVERRAYNFLSILIMVIGLLTFSRAYWVSLAVGLALFSLFYYRRRISAKNWNVLILLVVILPISYYMFSLQTSYLVGGSSNRARSVLTDIALRTLQHRPLLGYGPGEFVNVVNNDIRYRAKYGFAIDSHGVAQKTLLETGLIGLGFLSLFFLSIFLKVVKSLKDKKFYNPYLAISLAGLCIFIFELFNTSYFKGKMWLPIALALTIVKLNKNLRTETINS